MILKPLAIKISLYLIIAILIVFGIYSRDFSYAHIIILLALTIDNYMILYEGVSANCITPGYLILLTSYYLIFSLSRFVSSIEINKFFYKNFSLIILLLTFQWFIATLS